jgi:GNAT superfamily N-acetyltransferase
MNELNFLNVKKCNELSYLNLNRSDEWYVGLSELREQAAPESKLAIPKSINCSDIEIVEVTKLAEKLKWFGCFKKAYSGELKDLPITTWESNISKFYVAKKGKKELGFIRINNYRKNFEEFYDGEVWNIAEVYVKKPYRGMDIATKLMKNVIKNNNVKSILIGADRYKEKKHYFNQLGFTYEMTLDIGLSRVYLNSFKNVAITRFLETRKRNMS